MFQQHSDSARKIKKAIQRKASKRLSNTTSLSPRAKDSSDDSLSLKYGVNTKDLILNLEKSLSGSTDDSECWTPSKILHLVDSLKVPLEVLAAVIRSIKETFK